MTPLSLAIRVSQRIIIRYHEQFHEWGSVAHIEDIRLRAQELYEASVVVLTIKEQ